MRLYLPATLPRLAAWLASSEASLDADGVGHYAFAVTPSLREWYVDADLDELEHVAQLAAAAGALELLAFAPAAPRRRLVIAADLEDAAVRPAPQYGRAAVTIASPVSRKLWGSALVDDPGNVDVVAAAVAALSAAKAGDDDAQFALDEAEAHELGWYAVQELQFLAD